MPDRVDHIGARMAAAALASDHELVARSIERLEKIEDQQKSDRWSRRLAGLTPGGRPKSERLDMGPDDHVSRIIPMGLDIQNALLDDDRAYRKAARKLRRRRGLPAELKARLELAIADDPLRLANKRIWDYRESLFARTFNAVVEPLGQSLMMGIVMAPWQIANSALRWAMGWFERDAVSVQERQALVHWQRFLEEFPDDARASKIKKRMARIEKKLARSHRNRFVRQARAALERGNPRMALELADRAITHKPGDRRAQKLSMEAFERILQGRELVAHSLTADPALLADPQLETEIELAARLLAEPDATEPTANAIAALGGAVREDESRYVRAIGQIESGFETMSFGELSELAAVDSRVSPMARHAAAILQNPWQNPLGSFERQKERSRKKWIGHWLLGGYADRPRSMLLPKPIAYLIDLPSIAQTIATLPLRIIMSPWKPQRDFQRPAALAAYRYLELYPQGEHMAQAFDWLYHYESDRKNYNAALRIADYIDAFDPEERIELTELAAAQRLKGAGRAERRDMRSSLLRGIVREYPDSDASAEAGMQVRQDRENLSPQRIRVTRGFLEENPRVAGIEGLGLPTRLLDGDVDSGELHPLGVSFLGGQVIEIALVSESGDDDDPPELVRRRISSERLSHVIALVDETARRNALLDSDDDFGNDAQRDYYFERARLGLDHKPDMRATAHSTYVYKGMRERYGMVRGRESILPFDLVLKGSLGDMTLGAFPRWRQPKETPDAFLYR